MDLSEIPQRAFARHPWEVARLRFFTRVLAEAGVQPHRILDAGAGDGWFSKELSAATYPDADITCFDPQYTAEQLRQFSADAGRVAFTTQLPAGPFDLLFLLDVMEHVEDDLGLLRSLAATLAPGAYAAISVPAWQGLMTEHDHRLRHFRRYSPEQAKGVLLSAGLEILASGGLFHGLLAPRGLTWAYEQLRPPTRGAVLPEGGWQHGPWVTRAVQTALALDNRVSRSLAKRGLDVPGLSWWALCRLPRSA
jgi:SAM-dependent methyltransferase